MNNQELHSLCPFFSQGAGYVFEIGPSESKSGKAQLVYVSTSDIHPFNAEGALMQVTGEGFVGVSGEHHEARIVEMFAEASSGFKSLGEL